MRREIERKDPQQDRVHGRDQRVGLGSGRGCWSAEGTEKAITQLDPVTRTSGSGDERHRPGRKEQTL